MLALAAALLLAQVPDDALPRRYAVERVELEGISRTRPAEVRRHLAVAEGDVLDDGAVLLSRLKLLQLGWFSRVEARVERGSQRGLVVLVFSVVERNTLIVSELVLGGTGPQPLYGGLGLSQQNFLGRGFGLSGAFVYGGSPAQRPLDPARFSARASFFAPDVDLGPSLPRLVLGASALWLRGEEFTCADASCSAFVGHYGDAPRLRYDRAGGEVAAGIRPGPFERLFAGFRAESLGATNVPGALPPAAGGTPPSVRQGRTLLAALTGTYDRDTRDDFFLPRQGSHVTVSVTFGSPSLGGDYEYARWLVLAETAHGLARGRALRFLGAAGATQGDAPFFERFFAADWAYFSMGPAVGRALDLNFSTDSRYDSLLLAAGAEYAVPLWSGGAFLHRGYLAAGARALYTAARPHASRTAQSRTPLSADLALRLDTPVGSFNLSLGYALDLFL
ncbi:MAG TPA: BamA/TamA family outer membrane protein [Anaeromyxobacteraceae bacterium]